MYNKTGVNILILSEKRINIDCKECVAADDRIRNKLKKSAPPVPDVCDICGRFASKVFDKDYYYCAGCNNSTRISAVSMPYACKLLFQEITSVNILPRIRTKQSIYEANV